MERPELNEVPLASTFLGNGKPSLNITMSTGQWDAFLQTAYDHGANLIELDENKIPIKAYRKEKIDNGRTDKGTRTRT